MTTIQRMHPFIDGKSVLLLFTVYFCKVLNEYYGSIDLKDFIGFGSIVSVVITVLLNGIKTYHEIVKFYMKYKMKRRKQGKSKTIDEDQFD